MLKAILAGVVIALASCATQITLMQSPEAQIKTGADAVKAITVPITVLLRDHKITVTTAQTFRNMLVVAGDALTSAGADLADCRKTMPAATPDPCWPKVSDVVTIALTNIADIQKAVRGK